MKTITISMILMWTSHVMAQYTIIPDIAFEKALIVRGIDKDGENGKVLTSSIDKVTSLDVSGLNRIVSLSGIEDFASLTVLNCYLNPLTTLNVTKNTALRELNCYGNKLKTLDVSKNVALTTLYCHSNELTSLDLTNNTALTYLICASNQLTSLDVSKNTALTLLQITANQLSSLDISQNISLMTLYCNENNLTSLDVTKNTSLGYLYCQQNQLTNLDVTKNRLLSTLYCGSNPNLNMICVAELPVPTMFYKDEFQEWSETCNLTTGIELSTVKTIIKVYPNPCLGIVMIESREETEARVLNVFGEVVCSFNLLSGKNSINLTIEPGIYFVEVNSFKQKLYVK